MKSFEDKFEELSQKFDDRFLQARYSMWNALISFNGIIISASSFFSFFKGGYPKPLSITLILFCSTSILFLILNFMAYKSMYFILGSRMAASSETEIEKGLSQKENDQKMALAKNKRVEIREKVAILLTMTNLILIFGSIIIKHFF